MLGIVQSSKILRQLFGSGVMLKLKQKLKTPTILGNYPVWTKAIATELEQKVENSVIFLPSGTINTLPNNNGGNACTALQKAIH